MAFYKLTPVSGSYYANHFTPWNISSALTNLATLIDGVTNVGSVTGLWYTAIGIDLGSSKTVTKIINYDWSTTGTGLWGPSFHTANIYKSDNGTTWTFVEQFPTVSRSGGGTGLVGTIEFTLAAPATARYFCRYYSDPLLTSAYVVVGASEIEAYGSTEEVSVTFNSDSYLRAAEIKTFSSDSSIYTPYVRGPGIWDFTAHASGSATGVLLQWHAGLGYPGSTENCKITIQYSIDGVPHQIPNTPPYVVRDLVQQQGTNHALWHPNTDHVNYCYSAWIYYEDSNRWLGPFNPTPTPTPPAAPGSVEPFTNGSMSFSKLGTNTKLSIRQDIVVDIIVWLPEGQNERMPAIEAALQSVAPAHTKLNVMYERYYIAQTTTEQLNAAAFDSDVYDVRNGMMINKKPTIDSSYSGNANILGEL
jgi:hypothetical protein